MKFLNGEIKMSHVLNAYYDGKVFKPDEDINLEKNKHYILSVKEIENIKDEQDTGIDPAFNISSLSVKTGIKDLASEHDYYLYGVPKRE